jgi:hypothetical protein
MSNKYNGSEDHQRIIKYVSSRWRNTIPNLWRIDVWISGPYVSGDVVFESFGDKSWCTIYSRVGLTQLGIIANPTWAEFVGFCKRHGVEVEEAANE